MIPQSNRPGQAKAVKGAVRARGRLLIVEPDHLVRWSIATYFEDQFEVCATENTKEARALLDDGHTRALIISDSLPSAVVHGLEKHARRCNAAVRIVRIGSERVRREHDEVDHACLKKPFDLKRLAKLLGVSEPEDSNARPHSAPDG